MLKGFWATEFANFVENRGDLSVVAALLAVRTRLAKRKTSGPGSIDHTRKHDTL